MISYKNAVLDFEYSLDRALFQYTLAGEHFLIPIAHVVSVKLLCKQTVLKIKTTDKYVSLSVKDRTKSGCLESIYQEFMSVLGEKEDG